MMQTSQKLVRAAFGFMTYSHLRILSSASSLTSSIQPCRHVSSSRSGNISAETESTDNDYVNPSFINRNPRNLEYMGIAPKRKGWRLQYPTREFYHRLLFEKTNRHTTARVEHTDGKTVVSASTMEFAIAKHLYSYTDISAAENIGRILAQRCQECGITNMIMQETEFELQSEKLRAFRQAAEDGGIEFEEAEEVSVEYQPGIDYDNPEEVESLKMRQQRVADVSSEHRLMKKMRTRGRRSRRVIRTPTWYESNFRETV